MNFASTTVALSAHLAFGSRPTRSLRSLHGVSSTTAVLAAVLGMGILFPTNTSAQDLAWTQRARTGPTPSPRNWSAMSYDAMRGVTVLFGGIEDIAENGETWEWNGNGPGTWTRHLVTGPSPRDSVAMAYDSARGVTVLHGGFADTAENAETWEWNGTSWTRRNVSGPSRRYAHAMVYDSVRHVSVLFGGYDGSGVGVEQRDTWEWNGTAWSRRSVTGPIGRDGHAMAFDSARGVTVLFGGFADAGSVGDTWEWNGSAWTLRAVTGPLPRNGHTMVYDAARGVTVLFGGSGLEAGCTHWEWNGTTWSQQVNNGPDVRYGQSMTYDSSRATTVMFGGIVIPLGTTLTNETWELGPLVCCPADFDCDGFATGDDFDQYVAAFEAGNASSDFDHDGFVTGNDFDAFVVAFGAGC